MIQISSIDEANDVLAGYMPQVRELLGKDLTLERMTPLMVILGNPQDKLKIIHIAGTSGKTSTAYYIASLLKESGQKVGLTVSPHIDSVTERVQVDLKPISETDFCDSLSEFLEIISNLEIQPTYFEVIIAFVYWYFAKVEVDYAVIETGLGGLQDATNIAGNSDKICVITDIGLDHMHVLGNSMAEIAQQKAGIIHKNNQVFTYQQSPDVMVVFEINSKRKHAILNVLSNNIEHDRGVQFPEFGSLPEYQKRNWLLAKTTYDFVAKNDNLPALSNIQLATSTKVNIPGRMDTVHVGDKTLIMDGAHNQQKMAAFVDSFQKLYPSQKADILLALKRGKEFESVLPLLLPICNNLVLTTFDVLQDLPIKSINPEKLAKFAHSAGFKNISVYQSPTDAYNAFVSLPSELKIITGSFYLLSCVRPLIINYDDKTNSSD